MMEPMRMHRVLWLEDQWELFKDDFMVQAKKKGIELIPFKIRDAGIAEFKLHPDKYDAILTDALMPEEHINQKMGIKGVNTIEKIAHEHHVPIFISTGQPGLTQDTIFRDSHENVFIKGDKTDEFGGDDELFVAMLKELGQLEKTQIKRQYEDVFAALYGMQVEEEATDNMLAILMALNFPDTHPDFKASNHYNALRIVFENICKAFIRTCILPDTFVEEEKVNILESYRYLTGFEKMRPKHIPFYHDGEILPRYIAEPLSPIIFILNAKSHSGTGKVALPQSRYKLFSDALLFCETIIWAYDYIHRHPDIEQNKSEWKHS